MMAFVVIFVILLVSLLYHYLFVGKYDCASEPTEKKYGDYIKTSHSGWIRGFIIGLLLGASPFEAAIKNAAIFGMVNPIAMYLGY
jgi:galactitol-specific phosphotransferase system IIC component